MPFPYYTSSSSFSYHQFEMAKISSTRKNTATTDREARRMKREATAAAAQAAAAQEAAAQEAAAQEAAAQAAAAQEAAAQEAAAQEAAAQAAAEEDDEVIWTGTILAPANWMTAHVVQPPVNVVYEESETDEADEDEDLHDGDYKPGQPLPPYMQIFKKRH